MALQPCQAALDPYHRFGIKLAPTEKESNLISEDDLNNLVEEFKALKPFKRLAERPPVGLENLGTDKIYAAVHHIKTIILSAGVNCTPEDIVGMLRDNRTTPEILIGKFILDLIALNSILEMTDQLIYQAVINDQLLVINEDNIIVIGPKSSHYLGAGWEVECQPNSHLFFDAVSSVILADFKIDSEKTHEFYRVDGATISFGQDHGNSVKLRLRQLNEDLNPYSGLDRER
jgi:hypothetical protein